MNESYTQGILDLANKCVDGIAEVSYSDEVFIVKVSDEYYNEQKEWWKEWAMVWERVELREPPEKELDWKDQLRVKYGKMEVPPKIDVEAKINQAFMAETGIFYKKICANLDELSAYINHLGSPPGCNAVIE